MLGEPDDLGARARLEVGERRSSRFSACSNSVSTGQPCGQRSGWPSCSRDPLDHVVGERVAERVGVHVRLGRRVAHEVRQQPLDDPVPADDALGELAALRREDRLLVLAALDRPSASSRFSISPAEARETPSMSATRTASVGEPFVPGRYSPTGRRGSRSSRGSRRRSVPAPCDDSSGAALRLRLPARHRAGARAAVHVPRRRAREGLGRLGAVRPRRAGAASSSRLADERPTASSRSRSSKILGTRAGAARRPRALARRLLRLDAGPRARARRAAVARTARRREAPRGAARGRLRARPRPRARRRRRTRRSSGSSARSGAPAHLLLHGATGSGKTEVYLRACEEALERGLGAIVLVPEIALTPQAAGALPRRASASSVAVLHSRLTEAERRDERERIARGEARVVVGARSAVFAPVEPARARSASTRSTTRPTSRTRIRATTRAPSPPSAARSRARSSSTAARRRAPESWELLERLDLGGRLGASLPPVKIVDLRREAGLPALGAAPRRARRDRGPRAARRSSSSTAAASRRRSTAAPAALTPRCEHCDVALTLHGDGRLHCHHCGLTRPAPTLCPALRRGRAGAPRRGDRARSRRSSPSGFPGSSCCASTRTRPRIRRGSPRCSRASRRPTASSCSARRWSRRATTSRACSSPRSSTPTPGSACRTSAPRSGRSSSSPSSPGAAAATRPAACSSRPTSRTRARSRSPRGTRWRSSWRASSTAAARSATRRSATSSAIVVSGPTRDGPLTALRELRTELERLGVADLLGPAPLLRLRGRHRAQLLAKTDNPRRVAVPPGGSSARRRRRCAATGSPRWSTSIPRASDYGLRRVSEVEGQVRDEQLDAEREARRRLALAQVRQYPGSGAADAGARGRGFDEALGALVERMGRLMQEARGVGLAAPQIGILQRVLVYQTEEDGPVTALVNPQVVSQLGGARDRRRGLPVARRGDGHRPRRAAGRVTVEAATPAGEDVRIEAEGLEARVIQHELDHLDGILTSTGRRPRSARRRSPSSGRSPCSAR